jgi:nucleotide-binding universal stress UspA family protein|tara:strand:+ start:13006 stop:13449 length:444 start_codon:yes stop_codon:yes gene_type:complete
VYNAILLPIDPETVDASVKAIASAVRVAQDYDADLHLLSVVLKPGAYASTFFPPDFIEKNVDVVRKKLDQIRQGIDLPSERLKLHVAIGSIYDEIIALSRKFEIDLIVMASHRPELSDYLLGPNAARVVRHAACSVMVVRQQTDDVT